MLNENFVVFKREFENYIGEKDIRDCFINDCDSIQFKSLDWEGVYVGDIDFWIWNERELLLFFESHQALKIIFSSEDITTVEGFVGQEKDILELKNKTLKERIREQDIVIGYLTKRLVALKANIEELEKDMF